jgi:hypothetical protein
MNGAFLMAKVSQQIGQERTNFDEQIDRVLPCLYNEGELAII